MAEEKLRFRVLGPLEVRRGDDLLPVPGRKPRALLALLLLHANEVVPRERLIDGLWGETPPENASNALQVHVHALRKALGATRVRTEGTGYRLVAGPDEIDLARFDRLIGAQRHAEALAEWRGPPLAGLEEEPFAPAAVARLEEARLEATEARIEAELSAGRGDGLVGELESLVAEHPYRESLRASLMRVLYAVGRQADALDVYRATRRLLDAELGLEPSPELQQLEAQILRHDPSLGRAPGARVALPAPPTPLVGRELERAAVAALLRDDAERLVTLTGPGGTGKTRLAIAAAEDAAADFERVDFVDLAPLDSHELVVSAIAAALGVPEAADSSLLDALLTEAADRRALLVLDNFEHVLDAAPAVADLLRGARALKVLATSRAPLHLAAEREYPVPPLEPVEAQRLFVARAASVAVDVAPQDRLVAEICESLDRLPLAIELAAARTRLFALPELRTRLEHRLELLTSVARDVPERHRTLRATIDWSHDLLSPTERDVFLRLEPFAGPFTLADAEAAVGAPVDVLAAVIDSGLVLRTASGRLRVLETVREYAAERLSHEDRVRAQLAHANHYLAVAERHAPALRGPGAEPALGAIDIEYDNLRAALGYFRDQTQLEEFLRLIRALDRYWYVRGFLSEGRGWIDEGLAQSDGLRTTHRALALKSAALIMWRQGEHGDATRHAEEARALLVELGDEAELIGALILLGAIAQSLGKLNKATPLYDQAITLARRLDRRFELALVLTNAAGVASELGELERRDAMYEEAQEIARSIDATELVAFTSIGLAWRGLVAGDLDDAARHATEGLALFERLGFRDRMSTCCAYLADVTRRRGEHERSARLLGAASRFRSETGAVRFSEEIEIEADITDALRRELGEPHFEALHREGENMADDVVARETRERPAS